MQNPEDEEDEQIKKVEAALFISARFVSVQELVILTGINPIMLRELLEKLKEKYSLRDSAIEIVQRDDLWKMNVKPKYSNLVMKFASGKTEFSKAEQETLAIIAYKQPIKQSIIVKIRGNKAYDNIKRFIEFGLVKARKLGHTLELQLGEDFYNYFQLDKKGKLENKENKENKKE